MFLFSVQPFWLLALELAALFGWLAARRRGPAPGLVTLSFRVALVQFCAAGAALALTHRRSIDSEACLTGVYGFWANGTILIGGLVVLTVVVVTASPGGRLHLLRWRGYGLAWAVWTAFVTAVHLRSALLCTV